MGGEAQEGLVERRVTHFTGQESSGREAARGACPLGGNLCEFSLV